jgi:hypothetical protein
MERRKIGKRGSKRISNTYTYGFKVNPQLSDFSDFSALIQGVAFPFWFRLGRLG